MSREKFQVSFVPKNKRGEFQQGTTIMRAAQYLGIVIKSVCGKKGRCGVCKVKVTKDNGDSVPFEHLPHTLACQYQISDDIVVETSSLLNNH